MSKFVNILFAMNWWNWKQFGTNVDINEIDCLTEESHVCHRRCGQTLKSQFKKGNDYVCPDSHFAIDRWILKLLCTNVSLGVTESCMQESIWNLQRCGQSQRSKGRWDGVLHLYLRICWLTKRSRSVLVKIMFFWETPTIFHFAGSKCCPCCNIFQ